MCIVPPPNCYTARVHFLSDMSDVCKKKASQQLNPAKRGEKWENCQVPVCRQGQSAGTNCIPICRTHLFFFFLFLPDVNVVRVRRNIVIVWYLGCNSSPVFFAPTVFLLFYLASLFHFFCCACLQPEKRQIGYLKRWQKYVIGTHLKKDSGARAVFCMLFRCSVPSQVRICRHSSGLGCCREFAFLYLANNKTHIITHTRMSHVVGWCGRHAHKKSVQYIVHRALMRKSVLRKTRLLRDANQQKGYPPGPFTICVCCFLFFAPEILLVQVGVRVENCLLFPSWWHKTWWFPLPSNLLAQFHRSRVFRKPPSHFAANEKHLTVLFGVVRLVSRKRT